MKSFRTCLLNIKHTIHKDTFWRGTAFFHFENISFPFLDALLTHDLNIPYQTIYKKVDSENLALLFHHLQGSNVCT